MYRETHREEITERTSARRYWSASSAKAGRASRADLAGAFLWEAFARLAETRLARNRLDYFKIVSITSNGIAGIFGVP